MARTQLTASTTLNLSPGDSLQALWASLVAGYDLCGFPLTIQLAGPSGSPTTPVVYEQGLYADGNLVGQNAFGQITIRGDVANPGSIILRPPAGPCLQVGNGAKLFIEGMTFDGSHSNADLLVATRGSELGIGRNIFGAAHGHYDIQPGTASRIFIYDDYDIVKPAGCVGVAHIQADPWAEVGYAGYTRIVTMSGPAAYSDAFLMNAGAYMIMNGAAFVRPPVVRRAAVYAASATTLWVADATGLAAGQRVLGPGIQWLTIINAGGIAAHPDGGFTITINRPTLAAGGNLVFALLAQATGAPPFIVYSGGVIECGVALQDGIAQDLTYLPGTLCSVTGTYVAGSRAVAVSAADASKIVAYMTAHGKEGLCLTGYGIPPGNCIASLADVGASGFSMLLPATITPPAAYPVTLGGSAFSSGEYRATAACLTPPR